MGIKDFIPWHKYIVIAPEAAALGPRDPNQIKNAWKSQLCCDNQNPIRPDSGNSSKLWKTKRNTTNYQITECSTNKNAQRMTVIHCESISHIIFLLWHRDKGYQCLFREILIIIIHDNNPHSAVQNGCLLF